jgi:hypothetical protein
MIVVTFFLAAGCTVERFQKNAYKGRIPAAEEPMLMNSR